jgi:hypothetical protein
MATVARNGKTEKSTPGTADSWPAWADNWFWELGPDPQELAAAFAVVRDVYPDEAPELPDAAYFDPAELEDRATEAAWLEAAADFEAHTRAGLKLPFESYLRAERERAAQPDAHQAWCECDRCVMARTQCYASDSASHGDNPLW